ncbi:MAG: GldG family protein [Planctomycetota bacterium]
MALGQEARRRDPQPRQEEAGGALAIALHVLLLVLVLGQVVYLATRHRKRWDLTSDGMYSLCASTTSLVGKLDQQLLVEAYFSPKDKLPVAFRDTRVVLDNFLDELVQLGKGKVVVQRFDPNSDVAVSQRCQRIGVQPLDLKGGSATSVSFDRHWQGLRFRFGGQKQKVIPQIAPQSSFLAEAQITPAIKEVVTAERRKFGFMEWPVQAPGQQQGIGWNAVRTQDAVSKRYEFQNCKDEDGTLVPDDIDTLFLFRPKDLTDRQKYVLDQFVVRGGTLCILADAAEYTIGQRRQFTKAPMALDGKDSKKVFLEQLAHYGIDWRPKVLADFAQQAFSPRSPMQPQEYLSLMGRNAFAQMQAIWAPYPYFFHPVAVDWAQAADKLATNQKGEIDKVVAEQYRKQFVPGMPSDEFLFKAFKNVGRGPGLYWPTWTGLRTKASGEPDLPEGVTGQVLLWSSPAALVEEPPPTLDPFGYGDAQTQSQSHQKFVAKLGERFAVEPRQQAPLMAQVRGTFSSIFAGEERPKRPSEIKEEEAKKAAEKPADGTETKPGEEKPAAKPAEDIGPQPPPKPDEAPKAPPERDMIAKAAKAGRIVIVGDSDFLRDDLVGQNYYQLGGPVSLFGPTFFANMLDWLAEDRDLVELQSRATTDRSLKFVDDPAPNADPRIVEQRLSAKTLALKAANIVVPCVALAVFGLLVFLFRRGKKRSFLESIG